MDKGSFCNLRILCCVWSCVPVHDMLWSWLRCHLQLKPSLESLLIAISPKVSSGCKDDVTLDTCTTTATILLELCVQLSNMSNGHDRDSKDKKNWEEIIEVSPSSHLGSLHYLCLENFGVFLWYGWRWDRPWLVTNWCTQGIWNYGICDVQMCIIRRSLAVDSAKQSWAGPQQGHWRWMASP